MKTKSSIRKEQRKKNKHCLKKKRNAPQKEIKEQPQVPQPKQTTIVKEAPPPAKKIKKTIKENKTNKYSKLNPEIAQALEADDMEINLLEEKLGISKNKKKLSKEYSKLECYGDDFLDFLDDLDGVVDRCLGDPVGDDEMDSVGESVDEEDSGEGSDSGSEICDIEEEMDDSEEEMVPMKEGSPLRDESDDEMEDEMEEKTSDTSSDESEENIQENTKPNQSDDDDIGDDDEISDSQEDHAESDTYKPSKGEDIYGNSIQTTSSTAVSKYIPPHLRKQNNDKPTPSNNNTVEEIPIELTRSITRILNKLSNDTIDTVTKQILQLYSTPSNSIHQINTCIFATLKKTLFEKVIVMGKLIPLYASLVTGIHIFSISGGLNCSNVDLASFMIEHLILQYRISRELKNDENKASCNYILFISYLYLFDVISSQLLYDIINEILQDPSSIPELYLEHLVLIMNIAGFSLRSNDPSSLKHVILTLQQHNNNDQSSSSRYQYLMETITQIKNNKKKKDEGGDGILHYKKYFGRMKKESGSSISDSTTSILNITLFDILNIEKRGRWWKIGASWKDKNMIHNDNTTDDNDSNNNTPTTSKDKYIKTPLQKTYFNTTLRKSLFTTIITSSDIDTGLSNIITLQTHYKKTKKEVFIKEIFYVILQSCSMEMDAYNPFYQCLVIRLCEYYGKKKCYFTLQLLFWDLLFTQLINEEEVEGDESATKRMINLTKMMIHFIKKKILTLNILKGIENHDWSNTLSQNGKLCLTLLFTKLLELSSDGDDMKSYITQGIAKSEDGDMLKECIYVFLMVVMKECPKMGDGRFRKNWKVAVKACEKKSLDLF